MKITERQLKHYHKKYITYVKKVICGINGGVLDKNTPVLSIEEWMYCCNETRKFIDFIPSLFDVSHVYKINTTKVY